MRTRRIAAAAAIGIAAVGLAGCSSEKAGSPAPTPTPTSAAPARDDAAAVPAAVTALSTAGTAEPDGKPFKLEVDTHDGQRRFEVKVAAGEAEFTVLVDDSGTRVISKTQEDHPDDDIAKLADVTVTAAQALQTAADREPGAQVRELEIDSNSAGATVWEVELIRPDDAKVEYKVDAHTGDVVSP